MVPTPAPRPRNPSICCLPSYITAPIQWEPRPGESRSRGQRRAYSLVFSLGGGVRLGCRRDASGRASLLWYTRPKVPPASPDGASRSSWDPCLGVTIQIGACRWGQGRAQVAMYQEHAGSKGESIRDGRQSRALVLLPADPSPLRPTVTVTREISVRGHARAGLVSTVGRGAPLSPAPRPPLYEHGKPLACMQGRFLPCGTIETGGRGTSLCPLGIDEWSGGWLMLLCDGRLCHWRTEAVERRGRGDGSRLYV